MTYTKRRRRRRRSYCGFFHYPIDVGVVVMILLRTMWL